MTGRRVLGLQGWLVAALLAVGVIASAAVLLVVLPTLESTVRADRAKQEVQDLSGELRTYLLHLPTNVIQLRAIAEDLRDRTGAEIQVIYGDPLGSDSATAPDVPEVLNGLPRGTFAGGDQSTIAEDGRLVLASVSSGNLRINAALRLSGLAPEMAEVQRRVVIAMIVVLGLAALAGIGLARSLGGRIRRLAKTAATLARGDLSARAPTLGGAPRELVSLSESLNGMAGRLESLVGRITGERDRERAMIGSLAEGVLAIDADGSVIAANAAAIRYLELPEGVESVRLESLPPAILDAVRTSRSGALDPERRQVVLPSGLELEMHVARLGAGEEAGTVLTLRDVTEERRLERARRDLVANVSHELKTPIAALKGFLELLEGDVSVRDREEFLAAMRRETVRLERLVEEQLQLARLDAGALPLEREEVDLAGLVEAVVASRVPLAERAGVTLSARLEGEEPPTVIADPARIEQVLLILLDNAQRHTPAAGRVEVTVGCEGQDAVVAVRDTGEGIAREEQPFVFDRFYRGDSSREGRSAGLGLAIARGLVAAHRGSIGLESELGGGTVFTVRLPLVEAGPVTEESPVPDLGRPA